MVRITDPLARADQIVRWRVGYVIGPEGHPLAGRRTIVCAYLIRHPDGLFLLDTGIGADLEVDELFRPVRWPLESLLDGLGAQRTDIAAVANCHLHFDHAGGNPGFTGIPIYAQRTEFEAAHGDDYTLPEIVEFAGGRYELLDGETEVWPGLRLIPTPGHTDGHQSLLIETAEGPVLLAGQSFNSASEYAAALLERELHRSGADPESAYPGWMDRVAEADPVRVLFAHDTASWERG